jgi:hypothetical protein
MRTQLQAAAGNLLDQDFDCDGTDQKWGADISYMWTGEDVMEKQSRRRNSFLVCSPNAAR